jgi:hypothetical protein
VIPQNQLVVGKPCGRLGLALRVLPIEALDHTADKVCQSPDVVPHGFHVDLTGEPIDLAVETVDPCLESIKPRFEAIDLGFNSLQALHHFRITRISHRSIVLRVQAMRTARQLEIGQIVEQFRSRRTAVWQSLRTWSGLNIADYIHARTADMQSAANGDCRRGESERTGQQAIFIVQSRAA